MGATGWWDVRTSYKTIKMQWIWALVERVLGHGRQITLGVRGHVQRTQDEGETGWEEYFRQKEQHMQKEKEKSDSSIELSKVKSNGIKIGRDRKLQREVQTR